MTDAPGLPPAHAKVLERAARVAGVPVAVHLVRGASETLAAGWGGCAACRAACASAAGKTACARSRASAHPLARTLGGPVTLVCHLGLGCVAAAWPGVPELMLTFGPYVPAACAMAATARGEGPKPFSLAPRRARNGRPRRRSSDGWPACGGSSPGRTARGWCGRIRRCD